jgi:hypothetical protein
VICLTPFATIAENSVPSIGSGQVSSTEPLAARKQGLGVCVWSMITEKIFPELRRPKGSHRLNHGPRPLGGVSGDSTAMKKVSNFSTALVSALALLVIAAPVTLGNRGPLATITGSVKDSKGNPLAGAVISLIKDGADQISKQTRTGLDGRFSAKIVPGRYGIRAIAQGFNEVVFSAVEVRASQELIYKFNLEPAGSGRTLPERRRDRDDVKWRLRAAQGQRSIFQVQEGQDESIKAIIAAEAEADDRTAAESENISAISDQAEGAKRTRAQSKFQ